MTINSFPIQTRRVNLQKILDAETYAGDAEAARDQSQTARDTAENHKLAAEAAATSATNTAASLTGFDLDAIAETKADTAVDVFVYDTSKDSDGGAWRHRTQGTSWYNETLNTSTRGSRREFPAVAVIVAEADKVTIYDGDDPALPMWMVFTNPGGGRLIIGNISSVVMLNGWMSFGETANDIKIVDFIGDRAERLTTNVTADPCLWPEPISGRNTSTSYVTGTFHGEAVIGRAVNDVAMTVLPDAPIDPATGLPVPTIAVATDGGTSVITDSGVVYDSSATVPHKLISFVSDGLWFGNDASMNFATYADISAGDGFGDIRASSGSYTSTRAKLITRARTDFLAFENNFAVCGDVAPIGLQRSNVNYDVFGSTMNAFITSSYNTGYQPGDIKLAALSDTDDTDLVGSGELVTNGTFDTDTDWALTDAEISGGVLSATASTGLATQFIPLTIGKTYAVTYEISGRTTGDVDIGAGTYDPGINLTSNGSGSFFQTVTNDTNGLLIRMQSGFDGTIDNVSVKLADEERSVNNNGLIVNGTITRTPVATGADLVAYSGFSVSNYLEGTDASYVDTLYAIGWEQTSGVWEFKHGVVSTAPIDGLTITTNTLKIEGTKPKALIRLSATTPSASQLEKIENDEKFLFQENAQATLYGTSDAVTALAHDDSTGLLHVGSSDGRSVFQGLRRVSNTTDAVSTAISASNDLIAEQ